jgi:5-carboxymethyl-2-hydroxymuconate isomerase
MPHLIVEYSANLDQSIDLPSLLAGIHQAALETGIFPIGGVRTRAARRDVYKIGDGHPDNGFIHVQARIGAGRTADMRHHAGEHIFNRLKEITAEHFARAPLGLTFEIVEMNPIGSFKLNNIHEAIERRSRG